MKRYPTLTWLIVFTLITPFYSYGQLEVQFEPITEIDGLSASAVQALDIVYDDIEPDRQAINLFLPDTEGPFPLVIHYHGGGFTGSSRDLIFRNEDLQSSMRFYLENGVAFATAGYRLIGEPDSEGVIKSLNDSKRALQFIRHFAEDLEIMPGNIVLSGGSAGAGTALWIATHDDMADPDAADPVLRESTRVNAVFARATQATYDIPKWESVVYADFGTTVEDISNQLGFERLSNFYGGISSLEALSTDPGLIQYREEVDILSQMSDDDPPLFVESPSGAQVPTQDLFHHHSQGLAVQTHALAANISEVKAIIRLTGLDTSEGETPEAFLVRHVTTEDSDDEEPDDDDEEEPIVLSTNDESSSGLIVYPNPTTSRLFIESTLPIPAFAVYSQSGQLILKGNGNEIDVSTIPGGTYFVQLDSEVLRFIKE